MIFLSNASLRYAVDICLERENYRVLIAVNDKDARKKIANRLIEISNACSEAKAKATNQSYYIKFENGSLIVLPPMSESARCHRSHLLIVDDLVDERIIDEVLRPKESLERLDYIRRRNKERTITSQGNNHENHHESR